MGNVIAPVANKPQIKTFKDLDAWQACRQLYVATYEATKVFPKDEIFGLTSQMRRAANSSASNIAEGFGRETFADKLHFYVISRGSITELQNHIQLAVDVRLLSSEVAEVLDTKADLAHKLVIGLIKATKVRI